MDSDRLREALPFLRLRTEEPEPLILFLFLLMCAIIAAAILLHIVRNRKVRQSLLCGLTRLARERGLTETDIALLRDIGQNLPRPAQLITSSYTFNITVGTHLDPLLESAWDHPHFERLTSIRQQLGFDKTPTNKSLRSTRELPEGLTLLVWNEDVVHSGFYAWILVQRDERALTIVPLIKNDFNRFLDLQAGTSLALRFWRAADTEYRMELEVHSIDASEHAVMLRHCVGLERLQLRDYYRLDVHFPLSFFIVSPEDNRPVSEETRIDASLPRIDTHVLNLSAGGLSVETIEQEEDVGERLMVDPRYEGLFQLAGLHCEKITQERMGGVLRIQLRFVDMPETRRSALVRQVYAHQMTPPSDEN